MAQLPGPLGGAIPDADIGGSGVGEGPHGRPRAAPSSEHERGLAPGRERKRLCQRGRVGVVRVGVPALGEQQRVGRADLAGAGGGAGRHPEGGALVRDRDVGAPEPGERERLNRLGE